MPKPVLTIRTDAEGNPVYEGGAYELPPEAIRTLSPELYDYLVMVHVRTFGAPGNTGDLDEENISSALSVDHSLASNLVTDASGTTLDPHTQYLNTGRHSALQDNPHNVTADQVGKDTAQWNANRLQGLSVATDAPGDGEVLTYTAATGGWEPKPNLGGLSNTDDLPEGSTNLYYTDTRSRAALSALAPVSYDSGTGVISLVGTPMLIQSVSVNVTLSGTQVTTYGVVPAAVLCWGVFMETVTPVVGPASINIGTPIDADLWGSNITTPRTNIADFTGLGPFYTKAAQDVVVSAVGGSFAAGELVLTAYYWSQP